MSYVLPSSINLIEYSCRPWGDIEFQEKETDTTSKKPQSPKEYHATRLLPRTDHPLFGQFPKLEFGVLLECDKCGKVLLPSVFNAHCNNPDHKDTRPPVPQAVAPVKSSSRNRKSTKLSTTFAASNQSTSTGSVTLIVSKASPQSTPAPPSIVTVAAPIVTETVVPQATASTSSSSTNGRSSRHKKSSKSNKRSRKEEKSEIIITTATLPLAEEHPAKVSKQDDEHLVAIAAAASTSNIPPATFVQIPEIVVPQHAQHVPTVVVKAEVLVKEEPDEPIATSTISKVVLASKPAFIKFASESTTSPKHVINFNKHVEVQKSLLAKEKTIKTEPISVSNEQIQETPVDHMPMSPVAVVNIVPVQKFQYLQQYLQLPTQPIVVTIPCTSSNTRIYSYPKPLTAATRAIRKIGSTYLLQNQRMDHQRADIQAITTLNQLPT